MRNARYVALGAVVLILTCEIRTVKAMQMDVSKTTYGERNPGSPNELEAFAFLVGKWQGTGKVRLPDGKVAEFSGVSWIGRYILEGTAIADELHAAYPDGRPFLGISLRQYDASTKELDRRAPECLRVVHTETGQSWLRLGRSGRTERNGQF
jgi:hypothetical protein